MLAVPCVCCAILQRIGQRASRLRAAVIVVHPEENRLRVAPVDMVVGSLGDFLAHPGAVRSRRPVAYSAGIKTVNKCT